MRGVNISVNAGSRREFESLYFEWQRECSQRQLVTVPPMSGPEHNSDVTYIGVDREFLARLREANIDFADV